MNQRFTSIVTQNPLNLSLLFHLLLAVPVFAHKSADTPAPAQPAAAVPVKPSEVEELSIENLKLKLRLYTQHKLELQQEEDVVNQDGEKLAEQIVTAHPGSHLDFKTLTIVSDVPVETAKPAPAATPASPAPADPPKK